MYDDLINLEDLDALEDKMQQAVATLSNASDIDAFWLRWGKLLFRPIARLVEEFYQEWVSKIALPSNNWKVDQVEENCVHCGGCDLRFELCSNDNICADCGACTPHQDHEVTHAVPRYRKVKHFLRRVTELLEVNGPLRGVLNNGHVDRLETMFINVERAFNACSARLGRKNFPNYSFTLRKLLLVMRDAGDPALVNIDMSIPVWKQSYKLPKLTQTLVALEKDWEILHSLVVKQ